MSEQPTAPAPKKKSDLVPRVITSVVAVPLLLALMLMGPAWGFAVLIILVSFVAAWEYFSMTTGTQNRGLQVFTSSLAAGITALVYFRSTPDTPISGTEVLLALCGSTMAIFLSHLFTFQDVKKTSLHIGSGVLSMVYCGLMPATLALIFRDGGETGPMWVLMAMSVIWGSDTGAYFSGRAFGKHKLAPKVSPKKTIEGALGGLLASITAVIIFKLTALSDELVWWQVFALAIPANFLGQVGDLCESIIKRAHGIKDSGVIIYGHGGILDRADALIFAAPWFYCFQQYLA